MTRTLSILLHAFLYALLRGRAARIPKSPRRICVIQTAALGDMVCTTPLFHAIKQAYPNAALVVVGTPANEALLKGNEDIDEYVVWVSDVDEMTEKIKALHCDVGITPSPGFPTLAALYLAGVSAIIAPMVVGGWCPTETTSYKILRLLVRTEPHNFLGYAPREYLRLLEPLGIHTDDTKKFSYHSQEADQSVANLLESFGAPKHYAIVAPSAGAYIKCWPAEHFAAVADHIAERLPVFVIGTKQDESVVATMMRHASSEQVYDLHGKLSIDELKAFIARATLFISSDTGPLYLAEAYGVATIDIVGPLSEHTQPPVGPRNIVVVPKRDKPQLYIMNARIYDEQETRRQAQATTVEEVVAAADKLLAAVI